MLDSVNSNFIPQTEDIYTRYNIFYGQNTPSYIQQIIEQTNLETEENNRKLAVWTTVLGYFNVQHQQLRGHDIIKIRERIPNQMQFKNKLSYDLCNF